VGECEEEVSCKTNPERTVKNRVKFYVCVDNDNIVELRWEIFGDPVAIAAASWCVQELAGRSVGDTTRRIIPEKMVLDLDITDELDIRGGCAIVIDALASAFDDYRKRLETHDSPS
jgi:NifU-like protein involved in Fe-S cluster formation